MDAGHGAQPDSYVGKLRKISRLFRVGRRSALNLIMTLPLVKFGVEDIAKQLKLTATSAIRTSARSRELSCRVHRKIDAEVQALGAVSSN